MVLLQIDTLCYCFVNCRYFELLIQKMAFNLDLNFLFALMDLFTGFILKEENTSEVKCDIFVIIQLLLLLLFFFYHFTYLLSTWLYYCLYILVIISLS